MVLHNPNNWHWVNKDVTSWARKWLEDNLTKIEAKEGDVAAKVSKVISMDGDVEVAQRKGKVITIFDVKLTLEYSGTYIRRIQKSTYEPIAHIHTESIAPCKISRSCPYFRERHILPQPNCNPIEMEAKRSLFAGSTADDDNVSGTITVPELSHELEEDEFVVC